jgi:hypothetical protein
VDLHHPVPKHDLVDESPEKALATIQGERVEPPKGEPAEAADRVLAGLLGVVAETGPWTPPGVPVAAATRALRSAPLRLRTSA